MKSEAFEEAGRESWLTILEVYPGNKEYLPKTCLCRCKCGNERVYLYRNVKTGHSSSCGCRFAGHKMSGTRIHKNWKDMRQRCENEDNESFENYGGRGIKVCERWQLFVNFFEDMGNPPDDTYSIDRIDNDGDYCPENCRWATRNQQARNKRNTVYLTCDVVTMSLADWADKLGVKAGALAFRVRRGMSHEEAIKKPFRKSPRKN